MKHFHYSICKFFIVIFQLRTIIIKWKTKTMVCHSDFEWYFGCKNKHLKKKRNVLHFTLVNKQQSLKFKSNSKIYWACSSRMSKLKSSQHNEAETEKKTKTFKDYSSDSRSFWIWNVYDNIRAQCARARAQAQQS